MDEPLNDYFLRVTGEKSLRQIAQRAELDASTLTRQVKGRMTFESVLAICRAYGADLADALVTAGLITEAESRSFGTRKMLRELDDNQLMSEVIRRVARGAAAPVLTEPVSDDAVEEALGE